ncbi:MAG: hypothetical protein KJ052_09460 [Candidatus Hydrogenedentes bacterium]|nr:hypothetical protein [Candidatus Hydrogenedentota bacterium]
MDWVKSEDLAGTRQNAMFIRVRRAKGASASNSAYRKSLVSVNPFAYCLENALGRRA